MPVEYLTFLFHFVIHIFPSIFLGLKCNFIIIFFIILIYLYFFLLPPPLCIPASFFHVLLDLCLCYHFPVNFKIPVVIPELINEVEARMNHHPYTPPSLTQGNPTPSTSMSMNNCVGVPPNTQARPTPKSRRTGLATVLERPGPILGIAIYFESIIPENKSLISFQFCIKNYTVLSILC